MIIKRPKNNKKGGTVEYIVYKEGKTYVGVCLTFDIVEEGENPTELMKSIKEAAELHLETVIKHNLSDQLLNRYAPKEYWDKYFESAKKLEKSPKDSFSIRSPYYQSLSAQSA